MNNLQKFSLVLIIFLLAGYAIYSEGMKFYESQKSQWIQTGVNAVAATVQQKGELKYFDKDGKEIITLIKK